MRAVAQSAERLWRLHALPDDYPDQMPLLSQKAFKFIAAELKIDVVFRHNGRTAKRDGRREGPDSPTRQRAAIRKPLGSAQTGPRRFCRFRFW
jgi:hypothetical protein